MLPRIEPMNKPEVFFFQSSTIIDMNTLELVPDYKAELSVDPYYVTIRK